MGFKDPDQVAHCFIPLIWIVEDSSTVPLHLYLICIHPDHSQCLCFGSFPMPAIHTKHAAYFLHKEAFNVLFLCSLFCEWMFPIRKSIGNPRYFLNSLPMCLTYLSTDPSNTWLIGLIPFSDFSFSLFPFFRSRLSMKRFPGWIWSHIFFQQPIFGPSPLKVKTVLLWW